MADISTALALTAIAAIAITPLPAQDTSVFDETVDAERMVVLCDAKEFRFSIRASADTASLDRSYTERTVIDPAELTFARPNERGDAQYLRPLIRYQQCGPYTIKLAGDFLNGNIQGESGAYPSFAAITVDADERLYPQDGDAVRLVECGRGESRSAGCPTGYAVRIDGQYDDAREQIELVEYVSSVRSLAEDVDRRTAQRRIILEQDLSLWRARQP
jgi:hypothetical protein